MASTVSPSHFSRQRRRHGRAGVADLVLADERGQGQVQEALGALEHHAAVLLERLEVLAPHRQRRHHLARPRLDRLQGLGRLHGDDAGGAGLEDARLLARNLGHGGAELVGVVEGDRRDDAQRRPGDDIGGVEPPAETDLEDHGVGGGLGEGQEGGGGGDLEERHRIAGVDALDGGEPLHQLGFADGARPAPRPGPPTGPASAMRSWKRTRCGEV